MQSPYQSQFKTQIQTRNLNHPHAEENHYNCKQIQIQNQSQIHDGFQSGSSSLSQPYPFRGVIHPHLNNGIKGTTHFPSNYNNNNDNNNNNNNDNNNNNNNNNNKKIKN